MYKINEFYNLLKQYEKILHITNSKNNIEILTNFINIIEPYKNLDYDKLLKCINCITTSSNKHKKTKSCKPKKSSFDVLEISSIYNSIYNKIPISNKQKSILNNFNSKYPNIKKILSCDLDKLYNYVCSLGEKSLTIIEINFLLKYYFDIKPKKKKKIDLFNDLINNIYEHNYLEQLNVGYDNIKSIIMNL